VFASALKGASEVPFGGPRCRHPGSGVRDPEPLETAGVKGFNGGDIMRWSFWPVSITFHIALGIAAFVVPLVADVTPPTPAPIHMFLPATKTVPVPEEVIVQAPRPRTLTPVNVVAPTGIAPERKQEPKYFGPPTIDIPNSDGVDLSIVGTGTGVVPVAPPAPPPPQKPAQTLFRPGGEIKEPKRISGLPPEYPRIAIEAKKEGMVILEAVIDEHGEVGRIKVLRSQPFLDQAAITAVQQWRYTPTLLNGVPVSVLMTITVNFTLQK
jgi:periplasmic protein TonB